jgi:hypothetical protein
MTPARRRRRRLPRWYHWAWSPTTAQTLAGGRPLDPEQPPPDPAPPTPGAEPGSGGSGRRRATPPPGLRAQFAATRLAAIGFVRAHLDLARVEFEGIKDEVARAAGLAAAAIACVILAALLVSIAGILFLGEWIFGSIGWGVLLGFEALIALALTAVLVALRVPGLGRDVMVALIPGVAVAIVLGLSLPNELFTRIGQALNLSVDPAVLPLVVGAAIVGLVGAVTGLLLGSRAGGAGAILGGFVLGALLGALLGAFLSISFGPRVGPALGTATFLAVWPALMGLRVKRQGIDIEDLKGRFTPQTTIETTKESIEWAKARLPGGPRS